MRIIPVGRRYCLGKYVHYSLLRSGGGWGLEVACRGECAAFPRLSADEASVRALLRRMIRGQVTPVTAADVVADWLER